jgi:carbon monoxide dehydrogenase subunit G
VAERTEGTIEIEAPASEIMEVISDYPAYPEWSDVAAAEVLENGEDGRPTRVAFKVSQMGFDAEYTLAYEYAPDDGGVSWTTVEASGALKDVQGEYVLEAQGDSTRVTYRMAAELAMPVPGIIRRQGEKRVVKTALEGLKKRVEEG